MFDSTLIKDERRKDFAKLIKEDSAFFKHADTDANATRAFNPLVNDLLLSMSVIAALRMKEKMHNLELAFNFWNVIHNRHWFPEYIVEDQMPIGDLKIWKGLEKQAFLRAFIDRANTQANG